MSKTTSGSCLCGSVRYRFDGPEYVFISVDTDVLKNPAAHPVAAKHYRDEEEQVIPALRELAQKVRDRGIDVLATLQRARFPFS